MANGGGDARSQLVGLLIDKVAEDNYPSSTMMDLIEELLQPDEVDGYAEVLMDKIRDENYPSVSLMKRLVDLTS